MAVTDQKIAEHYAAYNGDCCEVLPTLPDQSIDISVYSPPFSELYQYSSSDRDMSNCASYEQFLEHYSFLVRQIARLTKPGRMTCVHCMDLRVNGQRQDFPGDIIRMHQAHGWQYHGHVVIWKEPWAQALKTRALGLRHGQIVKDSTKCHEALPDHLVIMRRAGENKVPVTHEHGFTSYAGEQDSIPTELWQQYAGHSDPRTNVLSHHIWRRYASSVWMDIRNGNVLPYQAARDKDEEKHICPLQLDTIERAIHLYSNEGETLLTPFMGVGSEVYSAVVHGRRGIGVELKPSYYKQALNNLSEAEKLAGAGETGDLFAEANT